MIKSSKDSKRKLKLVEEAEIISLKHRMQFHDIYKKIIGTNFIEYVELYIVSPEPYNDVCLFSSKSMIEYNLITTGLWESDPILDPDFFETNSFCDWGDIYHFSSEIKKVRLFSSDKNRAFSLVRKCNDYHLIYSFVLKISSKEWFSLIKFGMNNYLKIGDYLYSESKNYWKKSSSGKEIPDINYFSPFNHVAPSDMSVPSEKIFKPKIIFSKLRDENEH